MYTIETRGTCQKVMVCNERSLSQAPPTSSSALSGGSGTVSGTFPGRASSSPSERHAQEKVSGLVGKRWSATPPHTPGTGCSIQQLGYVLTPIHVYVLRAKKVRAVHVQIMSNSPC